MDVSVRIQAEVGQLRSFEAIFQFMVSALKRGSMKRIAFLFFAGASLVVSAYGASFDCAKAKSKVEVGICQNSDLNKADLDLNNSFNILNDKLDKIRKKSLVNGQRRWLQLRDKACITGDAPKEGDAFQECLLTVYKERIGEFTDEIKFYDYINNNEIASSSDFEKELDLPFTTDTLSHHPEHPKDEDINTPDAEYNVKSCREFFTLTSGLWQIENEELAWDER